jgi:hypothetical protein
MVKPIDRADMVLVPVKRATEFADWETLATVQGMTVLRRPLQSAKP